MWQPVAQSSLWVNMYRCLQNLAGTNFSGKRGCTLPRSCKQSRQIRCFYSCRFLFFFFLSDVWCVLWCTVIECITDPLHWPLTMTGLNNFLMILVYFDCFVLFLFSWYSRSSRFALPIIINPSFVADMQSFWLLNPCPLDNAGCSYCNLQTAFLVYLWSPSFVFE